MGQGIGRVPEAPAVGGEAAAGREPIGRFIAQQRRLRGIDLEDLAARTRIPRRSLERLEAGAFDRSPDGFSRGFVRTVAEAIGLDPDDAVARMLPEPDPARRGRPRERRALGAVAAAVALGALALGANELVSRLPVRTARPAAGELPARRDYVRALAKAQGVATVRLTARDAVLAPLPPLAAEAVGDAVLAAQQAERPAREPTAGGVRPAAVAASAPLAAPPAVDNQPQPAAPGASDAAPLAEIATEPALRAAAADAPPEAQPAAQSAATGAEAASPPPAAPAAPPSAPAADAEDHD
jgi:hypothetical protein